MNLVDREENYTTEVRESYQESVGDMWQAVQEPDSIRPLDIKFYLHLLNLEEEYAMKQCTVDTIHQIIKMYARCVEYYDFMQDPIKTYFMEKIQITLSNMDSLSVIYSANFPNEDEQARNSQFSRLSQISEKETIVSSTYDNLELNGPQTDRLLTPSKPFYFDIQALGINPIEEIQVQKPGFNPWNNQTKNEEIFPKIKVLEPIKEMTLQQKRDIYQKNAKKNHYSISKQQKERAKKIQIFNQIHQEKSTRKNQLTSIIDDYTSSAIIKDQIISQSLQQQEDIMMENLKKRSNF